MSIRDANLVQGEYYHIYNRGNGKMEIFKSKSDYDRFMKLLYLSNSQSSFKFRDSITAQKIDAWDYERGEPIVEVCAWVLMPNHFHIVLKSHRSDLWKKGVNPITEFARKLSTSYVMYFNKKYSRTGSLFEGKYKSKHIGNDGYFKYIFAYVHLNPIKLQQADWKEEGINNTTSAISFLENYHYSSFLDYFGASRKQSKILNGNSLPDDFKVEHTNELLKWFVEESPQV